MIVFCLHPMQKASFPSHASPAVKRASSSDVSCCCFLLMPFPFYYNVDLLLMQKGKQKITHPSLEFICLWCTLWPGMGPPHNYYVLCNPNRLFLHATVSCETLSRQLIRHGHKINIVSLQSNAISWIWICDGPSSIAIN